MSNIAAVIPAAKAPLELQTIGIPKLGPHDLLVKNELIALHPVESKIAKLNIPPTPYPAIIGISFGGTVQAVGSAVTGFCIGDKVSVYSPRATGEEDKVTGNEHEGHGGSYGAYQQYVLARGDLTSKVPAGADLTDSVNLIGNLLTVVGLLSGRLGVAKPDLQQPAPNREKKLLIYGGSSSVGSLAVQYAAKAGYGVVTTSSPRNWDLVVRLGAAKVVDHTQDTEKLIGDLQHEGPFDHVIDTIALPSALKVTGGVLAAQGGGTLFSLLPAFGPESLPNGVTREFNSWHLYLAEEKNAGLQEWALNEYLPDGVKNGSVLSLPTEKVTGGLGGLNEALSRLLKGVSGTKLILDPWE